MNPRTRSALDRMSAQRLDGGSRPVTRAPEMVTWTVDVGAAEDGPRGWNRVSSRRPRVALSVAVVAVVGVLGAIVLGGHSGTATPPAPLPGFAGAPTAVDSPPCSSSPWSSPDPLPSLFPGMILCYCPAPGQHGSAVGVIVADASPAAPDRVSPAASPTGSTQSGSTLFRFRWAGGPCPERPAGPTATPSASVTPTGPGGR